MQILLIDDHPLYRTAIASLIKTMGSKIRCQELTSCEDALGLINDGSCFDLILLDLDLPGMDGLSGLVMLREIVPLTPVVILSATDDTAKVNAAIRAGANGYITKTSDSEVILHALNRVLAGEAYLPDHLTNAQLKSTSTETDHTHEGLTPRQYEVLTLLARGKSNKEIASQLDMAENTVRVHVAAILKFLNVKNRTEAGYAAIKRGLIASLY